MRKNSVFLPKQNDFDLDSHTGDSANEEMPMDMDLAANGAADDDIDLQKTITSQSKIVMYAKMILPHIGLVLLLFVYLIIGAIVFHYIEAPNEQKVKNQELETIFKLRDNFHDMIWNLWNLTKTNESVVSRETFNEIGQIYFKDLVKAVFQAFRNQFINDRHLLNQTNGDEMLWTYANSVFFSVTVITTIGYGNLVPATRLGRIACICFALFGIPLLLITIADIGKFLSDFLSFLYRTYRSFKRKVAKQSRRISQHYRERDRSLSQSQQSGSESMKAGSMNLGDIDSVSGDSTELSKFLELQDELRIPVVMVLFVLVAYTTIGGVLFQALEEWPYFDAFYFCFITMATIGFGDIVPTRQVYLFFTMAYIIFGLSLATMCIDLAGTEYIRKIHYIGTKMEDAKGAVMTGLQVGEHLLKHTGIEVIRTAGGKLVQVGGAVLSSKQAQELGVDYILADLEYHQKNILYEPLSQAVQKLVKSANIKVLPDELTENDGYIVQNKSYDKPGLKKFVLLRRSPNAIKRVLVPSKGDRIIIVPFLLKETKV
uniref:Ion channel n=1 Tax=Syphacia muris TaxID=451379 RepID=A0A0N5ALA9_9BILA